MIIPKGLVLFLKNEPGCSNRGKGNNLTYRYQVTQKNDTLKESPGFGSVGDLKGVGSHNVNKFLSK